MRPRGCTRRATHVVGILDGRARKLRPTRPSAAPNAAGAVVSVVGDVILELAHRLREPHVERQDLRGTIPKPVIYVARFWL
jgi:hypothetical protein